MNTSVIIRKKAGQVIPKAYLQEALKNCPTCFGITIQDKDESKNAFLENSSEAKALTVDELMATVEACKEVPMFITLGNASQDFDPVDDLQPFIFQMRIEGEEEPQDILSVFIEGDFPNYAIPGKGHTDEYNLWEKFVYPTIEEKFDLANSDIEDFYNRLRASTTEQAVMNTVGHRAAIVFVPLEGEPIEFGRNELGAEYDWGTTSNRFKYGDASALDKAAGAAISAVKRGKSRLSAVMSSTAVSPPAIPKDEKPITQDANGIHHVGATTIHDTSVWNKWPGTSAKTHTMTVVPQKLQGNARNRWIRLMLSLDPNADLPKGKDVDGFSIPVPNNLMGFAQKDVSTNDEVKTLVSSVKHFQAGGAVTQEPIPNEKIREAEATPVKEEKVIGDKRDPKDFLPEMSAETKKGTVDLVTEWATRPNGPTMLEIQRQETKWPKFSTMNDIKFEDMMKWTIADRKAICKKYPDAAAIAMGELQMHILENGVGLTIKVEEKNPDHKTKTQVDVPPAQPQPAPAKKSRLSQLKGAA